MKKYDIQQLHFTAGSTEAEILKRFMSADAGLPEGLIFRMTYFSAVTATTLGYGDIVPITTASRFWVALESIFGLVLMGILVWWTTRPVGKTTGG